MAKEANEIEEGVERQGTSDAGPIRPVASQTSTVQDTPSPGSSAPAVGAEIPPPRPLHRSGTLPTAPRRNVSVGQSESNRPRGRTISAKTPNLQPRELSPRSQIFKKTPLRSENNEAGPSLDSITEGQKSSATRPRESSTSEHEPRFSFSSPGLRARTGTWATQGPATRGIQRRPTVLLAAPQAMATGRDDQSMNFTLAGPAPIESVAANQPYVDVGYAELNPAYEQPQNTRPVWGLAKPLPRVIRPGMVPTRSELQVQIPEAEQRRKDPDLEQGRIEPTLRLGRVTSQLQNAREERENKLFQDVGFSGTNLSYPLSPLARRDTSNLGPTNEPFSPSTHKIDEGEEDVGQARLRHSNLPPVPEQAVVDGDANDYFPADGNSILTEKLVEGDLDGDWIGEDIPLKAYDPDTDEIHNLHTHWSVIRLRFREPLAELLAVTVQLTLGFCADLVVTTSAGAAGNEATTDWAWGLASMVGIYIAGGISGAHLNPAISIMLWIYRGFPLRKVPIYTLAQILGAFIATMISFGLYQEGIRDFAAGANLKNSGTMSAFLCYPRHDYIGGATAFFTEFTGTACLAVAVLALGDDTNAPPGAGMSAFVLGLVITVLSMAFGYNTGAAMNPARDLGPRLALLALGYGKQLFTDPYWFWGNWLGPISGAIFGAFLYDAAIFVGGESPVNYPRRRIKRAGKKWRARWGQRIKKTRARVVGNRGEEGRYAGV